MEKCECLAYSYHICLKSIFKELNLSYCHMIPKPCTYPLVVYTVGIRSSLYPPSEEMRLKEMGAEFYRTSRGGLITFHGPGQLVAYPVLNLQVWTPSVKWYVCQLEKTIIELCHQLDIYASTSPYTGVWVQNKKIAAIGIRMSRWVTSHGIGLNCNTDLSWFDHIVPCGIADKGVTSLSQEVGGDVSVSDATPFFLSAFSHVFHCSFKSQTLDELWYDLDNSSR
ncbi:unnamed protein product [Darwinula stevensoni]|uniref:lipoyl(octanoyl) transferase n=1 Tax=Darwinula stevensoni TaxID=69355 RepID=A0A7R8X994_9CRUS|nr:unnamed protein product [Darwinula stevensoni]CAG0885335.1 unnamed protein product [Darwinula stevensoni]